MLFVLFMVNTFKMNNLLIFLPWETVFQKPIKNEEMVPDGMTANGLSTSVSVLGPERVLKLVEETPGTAAHIVRQAGDKIEVIESSRGRTSTSSSLVDRRIGWVAYGG